LSLEAWQEYFQQKAIDTNTSVLGEIHQAYQGNALAMKMLRSRIADDYDHSIADYWTSNRTQEGVVVEQAIENLIIEQFNRLQEVCPTAYQLLYRMGCFRFQDVPTVPREGLLCLLWGIVEHEGVKAIRDLGDRGLVERVNREYKLHPLIRQEAVKRLQDSEDWEQANRTAAEFWRNLFEYVDNINQLKQSFEAFHHYFAIPDDECAVEIIVESRKANWISPYPFQLKWYKQETLCELNRRLGLYTHQIITAVRKILPHTENLCNKAILYVSLSESVWILGDIREAIKFYQQAREALSQGENRDVKLDCIARFSQAICYLELGEIEEALDILNPVYEDARQHNIYFYLVETSFALAATYSYLGNTAQAQLWINKHKEYYQQYWDNIGDWAIVQQSYFLGETYKIFQDYSQSKIAYQQSLEDAEKTQYVQVKGKVLTRLAELCRLQKKYKDACKYHTQSIEILEKLGAKCDLAEAYYQLGLTYQETGELAQSQDYFKRAIELWEKINAPKQVARVRESIKK